MDDRYRCGDKVLVRWGSPKEVEATILEVYQSLGQTYLIISVLVTGANYEPAAYQTYSISAAEVRPAVSQSDGPA